MIKVAASEERETVRRKAVQGRAEENPNVRGRDVRLADILVYSSCLHRCVELSSG